jgi:hypothetical protein
MPCGEEPFVARHRDARAAARLPLRELAARFDPARRGAAGPRGVSIPAAPVSSRLIAA